MNINVKMVLHHSTSIWQCPPVVDRFIYMFAQQIVIMIENQDDTFWSDCKETSIYLAYSLPQIIP